MSEPGSISEPSQQRVGEAALNGTEEYIRLGIFEAESEERWIQGKGTLIMIIHPTDPAETKTHKNISEDTRILVPPLHKVKVIDALVKMTK